MTYLVKIIKRQSSGHAPEADDVVVTLPEVFPSRQEAVEHAEECLRSDLYPADSHSYDITDGRGDTVLNPDSPKP